jgi:hypothetical protein
MDRLASHSGPPNEARRASRNHIQRDNLIQRGGVQRQEAIAPIDAGLSTRYLKNLLSYQVEQRFRR